jgi:phage host-nuclease inhibitor protein Gam
MRYKPDVKAVQTIDDADKALFELCTLESSIEQIDTQAEREIAQIKERAAVEGKALRERIKEITATLKAWATFNKKELFNKRKSIERPSGTIGYRKTPVTIKVSKDTVELLKKLGHADCVRVKEEVVKESLKDFTDEELAAVNASRKTKETFFCQTKREQVNQDMLSKTA